MAVGGTSMISTANYEARKFGVRSAMPGFIAKQLCPQLVFVPCHFPKYQAASEVVLAVLTRYDQHCKMLSLDEAKLDLTRHMRKLRRQKHRRTQAAAIFGAAASTAARGDIVVRLEALSGEAGGGGLVGSVGKIEGGGENNPDSDDGTNAGDGKFDRDGANDDEHGDDDDDDDGEDRGDDDTLLAGLTAAEVGSVVAVMRQEVRLATGGLTCSAGIAPNFMAAKLASDVNKPNGQCEVALGDGAAFLTWFRAMPARKVGGVGKVTERVLSEVLGVSTVAGLYEKRLEVAHVFTPALALFLFKVGLGVHHDDERKAAEAWGSENNDAEDGAGHFGQASSSSSSSSSPSSSSSQRKGMGVERTFSQPLVGFASQRRKLTELCATLASHLLGNHGRRRPRPRSRRGRGGGGGGRRPREWRVVSVSILLFIVVVVVVEPCRNIKQWRRQL